MNNWEAWTYSIGVANMFSKVTFQSIPIPSIFNFGGVCSFQEGGNNSYVVWIYRYTHYGCISNSICGGTASQVTFVSNRPGLVNYILGIKKNPKMKYAILLSFEEKKMKRKYCWKIIILQEKVFDTLSLCFWVPMGALPSLFIIQRTKIQLTCFRPAELMQK